MVLIMVTSLFPPYKASDVQKLYDELQEKYPLPSFIMRKQAGVRWINEGVKGVALYEVEKANIADALNFVYRYEADYAGIAGFSDYIEVLLETEELTDVIPT